MPEETKIIEKSYRPILEGYAQEWLASKKSKEKLLSFGQYVVSVLWVGSDWAKPEGVSSLATEFLKAHRFNQLVSDYFDGKEWCCGWEWNMDNMSICVFCFALRCPQCAGNNNRRCHCGGELVG